MKDSPQNLSSISHSFHPRTKSKMMMQVKPVALTILVGTLATCNVTKPVTVLICVIPLFIVHTPVLEGLDIHLNLAKSPLRQTKLAAQLVTNGLDASAEGLALSSTGSTTRTFSIKESPSQQESQPNKSEQLNSEMRPHDEQSAVKSKEKSKKKTKGRKKTAASLQPALDQGKETSLPASHHVTLSAPIVDNVDANDEGWSLVSKKRRNTKPASERNASMLERSPEDGERHLVLRNHHIVKRDRKEKRGSIASSSVSFELERTIFNLSELGRWESGYI